MFCDGKYINKGVEKRFGSELHESYNLKMELDKVERWKDLVEPLMMISCHKETTNGRGIRQDSFAYHMEIAIG